MYPIAIVNQDGVQQSDVELFAAAADEWVKSLLIPAWPAFAGGTVRAVPFGDEPEANEVPVVLTEAVTQAGALAFHSKTLSGLPTGTTELPQCTKYNVPWTVACCHEIAEIFGNPELDQFVLGDLGRTYGREIVDFVTSGEMRGLGDVLLCNAVTPEFFDENPAPGTKFDLSGEVTQCLKDGGIPPGGWAQWKEPDGTYNSAYGDAVTPLMRAYIEAKKGRAWRIGKKLGA